MKSRFLLNVVVGKSATVLELFSSEDQSLLIRRDSLLVLNLGFDVVDGIGRLDFEGDLERTKEKNEFHSKLRDERIAPRQLTVFPVKVLTKICIPPRRRRTK